MRRIFPLFLLLLFLSAGCGRKSASLRERLIPGGIQESGDGKEAASLDALSASSADNLEAAAAAYAGSDARIRGWQGGASDFSTGVSGSAPEHGASEVEEFEAKPTPPEPLLASRAAYNTGTVFLMNDSPFLLSATVLAADGSYLGQVSVQPGQQVTFTQSLSATSYQFPGKPRVSLTPFTVIWQCPSRGYYSVCRMVSPGSAVMANDCSGNHFCEPKKEEAPATKLEKKSD